MARVWLFFETVPRSPIFSLSPSRIACWLRIGALLALPILGTACGRPSFFGWFSSSDSFSSRAAKSPLRDVLPGRWTGEYKGQKYTVTFGRHQEVAIVLDVPQQYRAALGTDQLWIGGNYHVENDHSFNCQWTDGRWAEIIAQMGGMPLHQVGVKSYGENEFVDGEGTKWRCLDHAPAGRTGEAVDIAAQAPTINDAPRAKKPGGSGQSVSTKTLYDQQQKLTVLYNQLQERRKKLNPKDKNAVAAFNRAADEYSREVASFNGGTAGGQPTPAPSPAANAR